MQFITFRDWQFSADVAHTVAIYAAAPMGSADACTCSMCKNYIASRAVVFPEEIKQLFVALGIDRNKESEISHYCRQADGLHHYGGWFHFKGIFTGPDCVAPAGETNSPVFAVITPNFSIGFRKESYITFFEDKENLVQVEFDVKIPWVLTDVEEAE